MKRSAKIQRGQTNEFKANTSTSTWQIIKRNVFTLFNALNFVIALALVAVQAWSNLVFLQSSALMPYPELPQSSALNG